MTSSDASHEASEQLDSEFAGDPKELSKSDRHDAIMELVLNSGSMRIDDLVATFGVSMMTLHRDLDALAARGLLRKSRGMATASATSLVESNTEYRIRQHRDAKRLVAETALRFVEPGQAVILDDSTTMLHLADMLPPRQPLTVITNFQRLMTALAGHPGIALIGLGGLYHQWCDAYLGSIATAALGSLRADVLFMSTPAITDDVCFHQHHEAAALKRAMFEAAAARYLCVDHSKFSERALHAHIALTEFDAVIVDPGVADDDVRRLREKGVTVIVADGSPARA